MELPKIQSKIKNRYLLMGKINLTWEILMKNLSKSITYFMKMLRRAAIKLKTGRLDHLAIEDIDSTP